MIKMKKLICSVVLIASLVICGGTIVYGQNVNDDIITTYEEFEKVDVEEMDSGLLEELNYEVNEIDALYIVPSQAKGENDTTIVNDEDGDEVVDIGMLQISSYDEENGLNEIDGYIFIDEDGIPLSTAALSSGVYTSALKGTSSVKIQCKYKMYTDGLFEVYINPYSVSITPKVSGVTYMAGDVMFHGIQVYTSTFKDISGTECSFATKSKVVASGIVKGTTYTSSGYYYSSSKALRVYDCGFHTGGSMYLEYTISGTKYSGSYLLADI